VPSFYASPDTQVSQHAAAAAECAEPYGNNPTVSDNYGGAASPALMSCDLKTRALTRLGGPANAGSEVADPNHSPGRELGYHGEQPSCDPARGAPQATLVKAEWAHGFWLRQSLHQLAQGGDTLPAFCRLAVGQVSATAGSRRSVGVAMPGHSAHRLCTTC
jgi:hypothetical protein